MSKATFEIGADDFSIESERFFQFVIWSRWGLQVLEQSGALFIDGGLTLGCRGDAAPACIEPASISMANFMVETFLGRCS